MIAGMKDRDNGTATRYRGGALFMAGFAMLAAGALVYSLDRPADSLLFLPAILSLHDGQAYLTPALGGPLPTFLHTMAFSLMTAALMAPTLRARLAACGVWVAVNWLFETAQHPALLEITGIGMPGAFDLLDMLAAPAGAAAALLLMQTLAPAQWKWT